MSFVYGLVPPEEIQASETCTSGVARVETERSFLNQLVSYLSFGIVTPLNVVVTCQDTGGTPGDAAQAQADGGASPTEPIVPNAPVGGQAVADRDP